MTPRQRKTRRIVLTAAAAGGISVLFSVLGAISKFFGWPTEALSQNAWWVFVPLSLSLSGWATVRSHRDARQATRRLEQARLFYAQPHAYPTRPTDPSQLLREAETEATLLSLLNERDADRYRLRLGITVTGSAGGKYLIRPGFSSNVTRLSPPRANLCAHPIVEDVHPAELRDVYDTAKHVSVIAQLLMIQTDELGYLSVAREYRNDR